MKKVRGILPSIAMAVVLLLGTTVAWATAAFLADKVIEQLLPSEEIPDRDYWSSPGTARRLFAPGRALTTRASRCIDRWTVRRWTCPKTRYRASNCIASLTDGPETPSAVLDWNSRIQSFTPPREAAPLWYFIHDSQPRGAGYLVGYDTRSKLKIGYIGRHGFLAHEPPPEEQFRVVWGRLQNWECLRRLRLLAR